MRFKNYLYLNEDEKTFKKLNVGLVKQKSDYDKVVYKIAEKYELSMEIVDAMNRLNKKLDNIYSGKFKFDFCLREDINIDDLKVKKTKLIDRLKTEVFKTKDTLAKSKTNMERKIIER